jgi:hypothetical protein
MRFVRNLALTTLVALTFVGSATAGLPSLQAVVPVVRNAASFATSGLGSGNLKYHGGPVMHTNQVYAVYWDPSGVIDPAYESTINRYFGDVAADSLAAKTTNVYWSDTQYYQARTRASTSATAPRSAARTPTPTRSRRPAARTA